MKKLINAVLFVFLLTLSAYAVEYDELNSVKEPAYRVGSTDEIENRIEIKDNVKSSTVRKEKNEFASENLTYADLSIKKLSLEIAKDLSLDYNEMYQDLSLLWQGAATKSDTIKFALYKLSNPDADKPDEKSVKKVLTQIASMSTLVGASMGNPMLASGAFLGGNILGIMSEDTKALNYKYTKVNDADMIILVRKIEELQQTVANLYFDYMTTRKIFDMTIKSTKDRQNNYRLAQNANKELVVIADAYYREALDAQLHARSNFYAKRAILEQLVGSEIFKQFEAEVNSRN